MRKINYLIVDDVEIDRLTVLSYISRFPDFSLVGVFDSPVAAYDALQKNTVDVIFLDIDMPKESGLDLRKKALEIPVCIFITSHSEYALDGFDLDALDYIVKPLTFARFSKTVQRIEYYLEMRNKANLFETSIGGGAIFIKEGLSETKVKLTDILYLEALKNYTLIVTAKNTHKVLLTIGNLLKDVHFQSFIRIHRGYAIQQHYISRVTSREVFLQDEVVIPIGRNFKNQLKNIFE